MRPRSGDRLALVSAAGTLAGGPLRGGTCEQLASLAGLDLLRAQRMLDNARRAGELVQVGTVPSGGRGRPQGVYAPASACAPSGYRASTGGHLQAVLGTWRAR